MGARKIRILIITDAAPPQVNGVVFTLKNTIEQIESMGHTVITIDPSRFKLTMPLPFYPQIKIALDIWKLSKFIKDSKADAIHIATEGPIGIAARTFCKKHGIQFTTSYHTKFPEYINTMIPLVPVSLGYRFMRWFHSASCRVLVTTQSVKEELLAQGFLTPITVWTRGVDTEKFKPVGLDSDSLTLLYVGRVSAEKNIEAFLDHDIDGATTVVVGDGPELSKLQSLYPNVSFVGPVKNDELASFYSSADVFVFPSKTDTFGIVMLEANACGTPVAAYPVTGPKDFVINGHNGYIDDDLNTAILNCLQIDRNGCREYVKTNYTWEACAKIFVDNLVLVKNA